MRQAEYEQIRDVLKSVRKLTDANKRFQFKQKGYCLVDDRVCQNKETKTKIVETKKVVYLEEFFEILYEAHCIKRMHQGIEFILEFMGF